MQEAEAPQEIPLVAIPALAVAALVTSILAWSQQQLELMGLVPEVAVARVHHVVL